MALDRLDTPLRLTWDLGGSRRLQTSELLRLADRIGEGQVFFLTLYGIAEDVPLPGLLERLAGYGCQVGLVVGRDTLPLPADLPLSRLLVDAGDWLNAEGFDRTGLGEVLARLRNTGYHPDLQLVPRSENLPRLPELIRFCADHTIPALKLPNVPLADTTRFSPVGPEELSELGRRFAVDSLPEAGGPRLEIHDLFLWELLTPDADRSGYVGCQAGNSVGHLDAEGVLCPCSSWPEPLGSLLETSLQDLWQSSGRSAILAEVEASPEECAGCAIYKACFGGCRGLAGVVRGTGGRDPMCGGPR